MARSKLESQYLQSLTEGGKYKKNEKQVEALMEHFNKNPVWDLRTKILIAESLGMTIGQVAKWNWDHRKKLGLDTSHSKRAKKDKTP